MPVTIGVANRDAVRRAAQAPAPHRPARSNSVRTSGSAVEIVDRRPRAPSAVDLSHTSTSGARRRGARRAASRRRHARRAASRRPYRRKVVERCSSRRAAPGLGKRVDVAAGRAPAGAPSDARATCAMKASVAGSSSRSARARPLPSAERGASHDRPRSHRARRVPGERRPRARHRPSAAVRSASRRQRERMVGSSRRAAWHDQEQATRAAAPRAPSAARWRRCG